MRALVLALLVLMVAAAPAAAGTFGTDPLPMSLTPGGDSANGPSGGATISGDDRKGRLAAFHSDASNLVASDSNGATDVFLWTRPGGNAGLELNRPAGPVTRVSVTNTGAQANGNSRNPALDGSIKKAPHCVAFESTATNLVATDTTDDVDVFVRDLRANRTYHVSKSAKADAVDPAIDGSCRQVAFTSGGSVFLASATGGTARSVGRGKNPDLSLDGTSLVWESGGNVKIRRAGRTSTVARGFNAAASDVEKGVWGVVFDTKSRLKGRGRKKGTKAVRARDRNGGTDVYTRKIKRSGRAFGTDLISAPKRGRASLGGNSSNGGITAYGTNRGFIVFTNTKGGTSTVYYRNNNSGNIDDLAISSEPITDVATSARGNFVAFSSAGRFPPFDTNSFSDAFIKHLGQGDRL